MTMARDGDKYEDLATAMRAAAAGARRSQMPKQWAAEFGMSRQAVMRLAGKLGIPEVLLSNCCRTEVEHGKGRRVRIGHRLLMAAFGEQPQGKLKVQIFPPEGGAGGGAILITAEE